MNQFLLGVARCVSGIFNQSDQRRQLDQVCLGIAIGVRTLDRVGAGECTVPLSTYSRADRHETGVATREKGADFPPGLRVSSPLPSEGSLPPASAHMTPAVRKRSMHVNVFSEVPGRPTPWPLLVPQPSEAGTVTTSWSQPSKMSGPFYWLRSDPEGTV